MGGVAGRSICSGNEYYKGYTLRASKDQRSTRDHPEGARSLLLGRRLDVLPMYLDVKWSEVEWRGGGAAVAGLWSGVTDCGQGWRECSRG